MTEAVKFSEKSRTKCIGITIETRPDYCLKRHLSDMLLYGCTRLEIGVQSTYEDVARDTNRGHTVKAVCESFQLAKDAGFKVVAHMMPNLPNVDLERDVEQFVEFFEVSKLLTDGDHSFSYPHLLFFHVSISSHTYFFSYSQLLMCSKFVDFRDCC